MTYEDIVKANETMKPTDLKGKAYMEVNQRITAFRMLYPEGFIHTHIHSLADGVCIMIAEAGYFAEDGHKVILGTGTAYEKEGSTFINKTSYIENCETSCIGRALGMMGLGIDTSIASAEEVGNAQLQQTASQQIDKKKALVLTKMCEENNVNVEKLCELYKVETLADFTEGMFSDFVNKLEKQKGKK